MKTTTGKFTGSRSRRKIPKMKGRHIGESGPNQGGTKANDYHDSRSDPTSAGTGAGSGKGKDAKSRRGRGCNGEKNSANMTAKNAGNGLMRDEKSTGHSSLNQILPTRREDMEMIGVESGSLKRGHSSKGDVPDGKGKGAHSLVHDTNRSEDWEKNQITKGVSPTLNQLLRTAEASAGA